MAFNIIHGDISKVNTDAIVNTANCSLMPGVGVCGAIYNGAGYEKLLKACKEIGYCEKGGAVITGGFDLPAKYVIHTVGPVWNGGNSGEEGILRSCYRKSLALCKKYGLHSVSFPVISSGVFGYPFGEALDIAVDEIEKAQLFDNEIDVNVVIYDRKMFALSKRLAKIEREFNNHEQKEQRKEEKNYFDGLKTECCLLLMEKDLLATDKRINAEKHSNIIYVDEKRSETFSEMLLRLITEKNLIDSDVYHRANVTRQVFSSIRCKVDYRPKKRTVLAFALALKLNEKEAVNLLQSAGYAFSPAIELDRIVRFCINNCYYNIFDVDQILFKKGIEPFFNEEK